MRGLSAIVVEIDPVRQVDAQIGNASKHRVRGAAARAGPLIRALVESLSARWAAPGTEARCWLRGGRGPLRSVYRHCVDLLGMVGSGDSRFSRSPSSLRQNGRVGKGGAMSWVLYAFISAGAAALTAVLAKRGVEGVPATLATAVRTVVVVVFAWLMVFGLQQHREFKTLTPRALTYLFLSGIGTGVSWLAYFRALQLGPASRVAPIDKLSLPLTILLAALWLNESITWKTALGVLLMTIGALLTL